MVTTERMVMIRDIPPLPVFITHPTENTSLPVVILFMHRPGLDEAMKIVCRDLAKAGYFAIGFDEYHSETLKPEDLTDESVFKDFDETLEYVKNLKNVDVTKLGVIGFCMGGRHVYLASAKYQKIKATVSFYGFPCQGTTKEDTPIELVNDFKSAVLGIFGREDHLFPFSDVEKFSDKLFKASNDHKVVYYENAGHGFLNPLSPTRFNEEASERAWSETLTHFKKFIV